MKTLTTSELNTALIYKGLKMGLVNSLEPNKWEANDVMVSEYSNGKSICRLIKWNGNKGTTILSYSKLKASEKREVAEFLLSQKYNY